MACALAVPGCDGGSGTVVTAEPTLPATGLSTLVVRWTINGTVDPNACFQSGAVEFELSIRDVAGVELAAYRQACTAFGTSVTLSPGNYSASGVLLNGAGFPRTTFVPIAPFTLVGNDVLDIPVDFPASSFL
jgi:hypothetical protein